MYICGGSYGPRSFLARCDTLHPCCTDSRKVVDTHSRYSVLDTSIFDSPLDELQPTYSLSPITFSIVSPYIRSTVVYRGSKIVQIRRDPRYATSRTEKERNVSTILTLGPDPYPVGHEAIRSGAIRLGTSSRCTGLRWSTHFMYRLSLFVLLKH